MVLMMILQPYEEPSNVLFLASCGADFAMHLTQYCIFRNGLGKSGNDQKRITLHYHALSDAKALVQKSGDVIKEEYDPSSLISPDWEPNTSQISLWCTQKDLEGTVVHKDPFQTIQDVLPHSVGFGIARKWILCGGKCFFWWFESCE